MVSAVTDLAFDAAAVAAEFVKARRTAGSFVKFPGVPPADLDAAYRCQDQAIALWSDTIAGWKVGWITDAFSKTHGAVRLVGPMFAGGVQRSHGARAVDVAVFADGFAAIEAELVVQLAKDAPAKVTEWTAETARRFVRAMYIGIEVASSPLQNINDYGPAVVVSDFGNNAGLVLGVEIPDWQSRPLDSLVCECRIDGKVVGHGTAASVSGGPLAALAFALQCNARRGRPLRAGDLVSTGAITGVHPIAVGQCADVTFSGIGNLRCVAVPMKPLA